MRAFVQILKSDAASYAAILAYLVSRHVSFPGEWLLQVAAIFIFVHARFERYRHASEKKQKRYFALGVGYLVFFAFGMLLIPFTVLLPLGAQVHAVWASIYLDAFYLIPATAYLVALDRMKEPNQLPATVIKKQG